MASKRKPGLPQDFSIGSFEAEGDSSPVRVGDYLDDDAPSSKVVRMARSGAGEGAQALERAAPIDPPARATPPPPAFSAQEPVATPAPRGRAKSRGKRKQVNFRPETDQALDEIIDHVARYSQEEPYTSEVVHALVSIARESVRHLDVSKVPMRGQHGSTNASVYRERLAQAFEEAIVAANLQRRELNS